MLTNNMKKILISFSLILSFFAVVIPAFAQSEMPKTSAAPVNLQALAPLDRLKTKADREIERRINSLQKLQSLISTVKNISADQKASLSGQVQQQITSLTALQTKIKADTDIATVKTDVQSVVNDYRIYALFIPKIRIILTADKVNTIADMLLAEVDKLQIKISEAKAKGLDVTALQSALSEMKTKAADAKMQANTAVVTVMPLTPEGYPANKTTLQSARNTLDLGRQDLIAAVKNMKFIIQGLLVKPTPSVAVTVSTTVPSVVPSTVPSAAVSVIPSSSPSVSPVPSH